MRFREFETIVDESLAELPGEFRDALADNGISVIPREKVPAPLRAENRDGLVFGVFAGVPYGRFVAAHFEPTRIELYLESFNRAFHDPAEIRRQVRITVLHEAGHYFGFTEQEIRRLCGDPDD